MIPVAVIGELNVDLILGGCARLPAFGIEVTVDRFAMTLGSASAIFAVGLARLGRPVAFSGKAGADSWGRYCVGALRDAGVEVSGVITASDAQTGVTVALTGPSDRALITYPGATGALGPDDLSVTFSGRGHLHVSSYFLQTGMRAGWRDLFMRARAAGWSTSLDPGCDPDNAWASDLRDLLPLVDLLLPNEVELAAMAGEDDPETALRVLHECGTTVVAKIGAAGAIALDHGRLLRVAPPPVTTVDTTGAGDSFNAGFLHAWLDGWALRECLRSGVACGALSTRALGGTTAQPTGDELTRCLQAAW